MKIAVVLIGVLLLFPVFPAAQDNYYTKENILKFADYLYRNGEYDRAIGEYCRVMALCGDARLKDTLAYRVAAANIKLSKPFSARKYCAAIPADSADSLLTDKAACMIAYSYFVEKKFDSSAAFAIRPLPLAREAEWRLRLAQIRTGALLAQYRWADASIAAGAEQGGVEKPGDTLMQHLAAIGAEGARLHLKSGALAGIMSAAVPGSGKVYAGRTWDGLSSLLMIGVMAWQSYEGYRKDGPVSLRCMTFGLLGATFYAGNIYGSVNAAYLYNQTRKRALCDRINLWFDW